MSELKPGKETSEHAALEALGVSQKNLQIISVIIAIISALAPIFMENADPTSMAAIGITTILSLAAKFGFKSHAVGKYAMGRSIAKAAAMDPKREL